MALGMAAETGRECKMRALVDTNAVVIDLDTGTVLGSNLVVIQEKNLTDEILSVLDNGSDSEIADIGEQYGEPLWIA